MVARKYLLVLLAAPFSPLWAQTANRPLADLTCVEDMSIPEYSGTLMRVAWIARATGSVRVLVTVAPSGSPATIDVQSSSDMLAAVLKQSFADAKFSTRCAGQTVEINFIYVQRGEPGTLRQTIRLRNANTFEIVANLPPIMATQP